MDNIIDKVSRKLVKFADGAEAKKAWDTNKPHIPGTRYITNQGYMREVMEQEGYPSHMIVHKEQLSEKELDDIEKKAKKIYIKDYIAAKDLEKRLQQLFSRLQNKEITLDDYKAGLTELNTKLETDLKNREVYYRLEYYAKLGSDLVKNTAKTEADKNFEQYENYTNIINIVEEATAEK